MSTPPCTWQLDVIRFPLTPKFGASSASESARTVVALVKINAENINDEQAENTFRVIFIVLSFEK
jgi:hypothetical protein